MSKNYKVYHPSNPSFYCLTPQMNAPTGNRHHTVSQCHWTVLYSLVETVSLLPSAVIWAMFVPLSLCLLSQVFQLSCVCFCLVPTSGLGSTIFICLPLYFGWWSVAENLLMLSSPRVWCLYLSCIYGVSLLCFHSNCLGQALRCSLCGLVSVCIMQLLVVAVLSVPLSLF